MNTNLLAIVKQIVAEQGEGILGDAQRLKPLFKGCASGEPKEDRLAFGRAIENGYYSALKCASPADYAGVKKSLVSNLQGITGFDEKCCAAAIGLLESVTAQSSSPGGQAQPRQRLPQFEQPRQPEYAPQTQQPYQQAQYAPPSQPAPEAPACAPLPAYEVPCPPAEATGGLAAGSFFDWICDVCDEL